MRAMDESSNVPYTGFLKSNASGIVRNSKEHEVVALRIDGQCDDFLGQTENVGSACDLLHPCTLSNHLWMLKGISDIVSSKFDGRSSLDRVLFARLWVLSI
jgi:hypothetical protein